MCKEVLKSSEVGCGVKDYCSELKHYCIIYGWIDCNVLFHFVIFVLVGYFCPILYSCIILLLCFSFCNFWNLVYVINMDCIGSLCSHNLWRFDRASYRFALGSLYWLAKEISCVVGAILGGLSNAVPRGPLDLAFIHVLFVLAALCDV